MLTASEQYRIDLGDDFELKSVSGPGDVERLATFNALVHKDEHVGTLSRSLLLRHPDTRNEHWLYVEEKSSGKIVSSIALIPWRIRYEQVRLKAGEMGIVGTLEEYRHKGLVRELNRVFSGVLSTLDFDLSHIQGIPYFYRQFGYEYAIPLERTIRLDLDLVADQDDEKDGYRIRAAGTGDLSFIEKCWNRMQKELQISTVRTRAIWKYLLEEPGLTASGEETLLSEKQLLQKLKK